MARVYRTWSSKVGVEMWLDDNPTIEGQPYLLQSELDFNGRVTEETWVVRLETGYIMGVKKEEDGPLRLAAPRPCRRPPPRDYV